MVGRARGGGERHLEELVGVARAGAIFAAFAFGFQTPFEPAAVESGMRCQLPVSVVAAETPGHSTIDCADEGGAAGAVPPFFARIVKSSRRGPGGVVMNVSGLMTIWSTVMPSSRCWTRSVWTPVVAK